ncbi:unnamed protein product [Mytilus edulis]|uniref:Uncharacterized protein n=1 Tax=Mytilus edulis TaxID=6550 RepID=A0A8S3SLA4_MYTED|nr:unnamed protein product [Mytilus edulis]
MESISQSEDTVSLNNKTVSKVTQDLKDDLKPGQEISRNKTSIRTRKTRMIEENDKEKMRKEVKCDIKDITVSKKGKEDTNIGKNSKKTIEKLSKKEMKSDNNTAEQHSIHESISIRQRSRRQSEKITSVKELDIKTENDSLKSDEFDNNQDSLPSPDSSFVRRSSRKRTDGLSVYKDFQLSNKKAAKSVEEDDAVCRSEENQSQVIDDVKVLNKSLNTRSSKTLTAVKDNKSTSKETKKEETKEKLNNKTSRPRIHNRNSKEAENCDIAEKSNDKK